MGDAITILYDKSGTKYGKGKGLQILVDGRSVGRKDSLQRFSAKLP